MLLLGLVGDLLFTEAPAGLNFTLWVGGVSWTWWRLRSAQEHPMARDERRLLLLAVGLGLGWIWRENELLRFLDVLGLLVVFALLALAARPAPLQLTAARLTSGLVGLGRRFLMGWLPVLIEAGRSPRPGRSWHGVEIARGALLALPSLLIFGSLLASADQAFGDFLSGLLRVDADIVAQHSVTLLGLAWVAAALLLGARSAAVTRPTTVVDDGPRLGTIEIAMALAPLNLLFLGFVGFQLPYFFGGAGFVERTAGVTLAEYARRGFFELCAVAGLLLPLLLLLEARLRDGAGRARQVFRVLAGIQAGLLLLIIASALHRMMLYQREFGLTEDRLFATAFIGGVAVTTCWFVATALRGAAVRFMRGSLVGWIAWLAMLHAVNPERVIVETNVRRAEAGLPFDAEYLSGLGDDAVPALVAALPRVPQADRRRLTLQLASRLGTKQGDVRGWSLAGDRAAEHLKELARPTIAGKESPRP